MGLTLEGSSVRAEASKTSTCTATPLELVHKLGHVHVSEIWE